MIAIQFPPFPGCLVRVNRVTLENVATAALHVGGVLMLCQMILHCWETWEEASCWVAFRSNSKLEMCWTYTVYSQYTSDSIYEYVIDE